MKPLAFVIPWFGEQLTGEAEQQVWQVANRLQQRGCRVEVLTTCCLSSLDDWSTNHLPSGVENLNGLLVRRFKVDGRNSELFNAANDHVLAVPAENLKPGSNPFTFGTGYQFVTENINSEPLERYLKRNKTKYHGFIFTPYLHGIILNGLPLVADKAWLLPCLHEEVYAYLPEVENIMRTCRAILYNTTAEERLAYKLFGPGILPKGTVVGAGVEIQMGGGQLLSVAEKGRDYAKQYAGWDTVIDRYLSALGLGASAAVEKNDFQPGRLRTIHQLTPGFAYGDAISNQALTIRELLRGKGIISEIFTEHLAPSMVHEAFPFNGGEGIEEDAGLIFHHSIGTALVDFVIKHPGPKSLLYHNVTPPDLVRDFDPDLAEILEQGLGDLKRLAPHFPLSGGASRFNNRDLEENGFVRPAVFPICVTPEKWNIHVDLKMMARLQDGKENFLFVGRLVANKCQHDLLEAFAAYRSMYGNCRLILVGGYTEEEKYYQYLAEQVRLHGLEDVVLFAGKVSDFELHACYRCAHLYWSMSEHEGFGVPLIEAMWFEVPVLAFKSSAVPETLDEGGLLFTDKKDVKALAAAARLLMYDSKLRKKIISGQKRRRQSFLPEAIKPKLDDLVKGMST